MHRKDIVPQRGLLPAGVDVDLDQVEDEDATPVIVSWRFAGWGWLTTGDAALAVASAARARVSPRSRRGADRTSAGRGSRTTTIVITHRAHGYRLSDSNDQDTRVRQQGRGGLGSRTVVGRFGPNSFRQDRALNRGCSEQKSDIERSSVRQREPRSVVRALAMCRRNRFPVQIEITVLLPGATLRVEQFDNRPGEQA